MRRSIKIALIVALVCILVGVTLSCAALLATGFELAKLDTLNVETKTQVIAEDFSGIVISGMNFDVEILPSEDDTCKIIASENEQLFNKVSVKDGTLYITCMDARNWYDKIGIWFGNGFSVKVYLPNEHYMDLHIETESGNIRIHENFIFHNIVLDSTSGEIFCASVAANTVKAESVSGNITLKNGEALTVAAKTTSGEIEISDMNPYQISAKATSGDISFSLVKADGKMDVDTVSGDIELLDCDANTIRLHTTSGDVQGTLMSGKNYYVHTTSGYVRVPASDKDASPCEITTTSGDIDIRQK